MLVLNKEEFINCKKSDTICVYGCGNSINDLKEHDFNILNKFDSVGFNWFCKSLIPTTFYLIREQANIPERVAIGETVEDLVSGLISCSKTCLIVHSIKLKHVFHYDKNLHLFKHHGIILNEVRKKSVREFCNFDLFNDGIVHGKCTLVNVLHICYYLGYKRVLFVGVDLYDSRYFWTKSIRHNMLKKKISIKNVHPTTRDTVNAVQDFLKYYPDVKLYTYNKKSTLSKYIGVFNEQI